MGNFFFFFLKIIVLYYYYYCLFFNKTEGKKNPMQIKDKTNQNKNIEQNSPMTTKS